MKEHDALFKQAFRRHLPDLVRLTHPWLEHHLRGDPPIFLPTELHFPRPAGAPPRNGRHPWTADLVVKLPPSAQDPRPVLLHVEVEHTFRRSTEQRLREYGTLAHLGYGLDVFSLAVYLFGGASQPSGLAEKIWWRQRSGKALHYFRHSAFHLQSSKASDYLVRPEPLAPALAALMDPGDLSPVEHRLACLRQLYRNPKLSAAERPLLRHMAERYLPLNDDDTLEFESRLRKEIPMALQEMTYDEILLSRGERRGEKRGEQRGRQRGQREGRLNLLLRQLEVRFGPLDPTVRQKLRLLESDEEVDRLGERVLTAASLKEMGLVE